MKKKIPVEKKTRFELADGKPNLIYFVTRTDEVCPDHYWIEGKRKIREVHRWLGQIIASWDSPKSRRKTAASRTSAKE